MYLKHCSSLWIVRKVCCPGCSSIGLARVGVFWALDTTRDGVIDLDGAATLIAWNRVTQYLPSTSISVNLDFLH